MESKVEFLFKSTVDRGQRTEDRGQRTEKIPNYKHQIPIIFRHLSAKRWVRCGIDFWEFLLK